MNRELVHLLAVGDTSTPIGFKLRTPRGTPIALASKTAKAKGFKDNGDVWFAIDAGRVSAEPTYNFTAATTDWLTHNDNKAENGDQVELTTTGTLPAGLATSTRYFVRDWEPNRFKLSLTPGGDIVDITDAGSGTHSYKIIGSGTVTLTDADVASAGTFWLWITTTDSSSDIDTFPLIRQANDRALRVEIVSPG